MTHTYRYPRPSLTVDCVVFGVTSELDGLHVLLVKRGDEPFRGRHALPGGFVEVRDDEDQGEDLETAARRELREETGLEVDYLEQLFTFGSPGRDPRGRVVSVAYWALVRSSTVTAGSDASDAWWYSVPFVRSLANGGTGLAFDHAEILRVAVERLRAKVRYAPIGFHLLPPRFTLRDLQRLYEVVLERPLDRANFRRRILAMGILAEAGVQAGRQSRPATLYRFDRRAYDRAVRGGFHFEI